MNLTKSGQKNRRKGLQKLLGHLERTKTGGFQGNFLKNASKVAQGKKTGLIEVT
jgi:hypothetical protein